MNLSQSSRKHGQQTRRILQRAILTFALLWLVMSIWQAPVVSVEKSQTQELRGVWMTNLGSAVMYYTTRLDEVVVNLAKSRLNTLYPAVWDRGYTLHPSAITKQAGGLSRDRLTSQSGSKGNGWLNPFHPQAQQFPLGLTVSQRNSCDSVT